MPAPPLYERCNLLSFRPARASTLAAVVAQGEDQTLERMSRCTDGVFTESGACVSKPWPDFVSCAEEERQGACPQGTDPNAWVAEHCRRTCERENKK